MVFEILMLNSLLILLNFFSNPSSIDNSSAIIYLKSLNLDFELYLQILAIFGIIYLSKTSINILISWKENKFMSLTRAELSHTFFEGYLYLPRIFHLRTNMSETIKNITDEIGHLIAALNALGIVMMEVIVLTGLTIFLLYINFKIALISFILLLLFSIALSYFNTKKIFWMGKNRVKFFQLRLKYIIEGLSGSKVFALSGAQKKVVSDFNEYNYKIASITHNVGFRNNLPKPLFELFVLLITISFLLIVFEDHSQIKNIIPTLGVFLSAAYRLIPSFGAIMSNLQRFQFNIPAAEKLSRDKEKFNEENKTTDSKVKLNFTESIILENISYSYNKNIKLDKNFVLKDINLKIKKGSKIGIIGDSGSGKSTFLDIIMGLIVPQKGKILVDEKKIQEVKGGWQKTIGCVPQDVFILDDTLRKNIAFGLPDDQIDNEKVNKAIVSANLTELKNSLKFGLETLVGDKGSRLSGGQRQRIGIARALYNDSNVLIFDEATNALDIETEKNIIKEIFLTKENKTIIFASHNLNNLIYCDSIYEVKGRTLVKIK